MMVYVFDAPNTYEFKKVILLIEFIDSYNPRNKTGKINNPTVKPAARIQNPSGTNLITWINKIDPKIPNIIDGIELQVIIKLTILFLIHCFFKNTLTYIAAKSAIGVAKVRVIVNSNKVEIIGPAIPV